MAIKGISDVVRLPRLGKITLGVMTEGITGSTYPTPTDHFVCPDEVKKVFGEKPKEINIMFPTEDEGQWASQFLKCYSATRGLICRGDGELAIARVDVATGTIASANAESTELREIHCNPETCAWYQRSRCRRVMTLQFLIPECPGLGVYQLSTSSYNSIFNINNGITIIRTTCGRVSMIPLVLQLVEQQMRPDHKKIIHVLRLNIKSTIAATQRHAQIPPHRSLLLPLPDTEAPADLFPQEILECPISHPADEPSLIDEELLQAWERVKKHLKRREVQSAQVSLWFDQIYDVEVDLRDFEAAVPPAKLTIDMLNAFSEALFAYEEKLRQHGRN